MNQSRQLAMDEHERNMRDLTDELHWKDAFRVLAVRRCHPFLADMGIPEPIVADPRQAMSTARRYLTSIDSINDPNWTSYLEIKVRLRKAALADITSTYGPAAGDNVRHWALRYFADWDAQNDWWIWSTVLPGLVNAYGGGMSSIPAPFGPSWYSHFMEIVLARFNPFVTGLIDDRLQDTVQIPLDGDEVRMLALEPDPSDSNAASGIDILEIARQVISSHSAYVIWREIASDLSPDAQQRFVEWAQDVMEALSGIPEDLIRIPSIAEV